MLSFETAQRAPQDEAGKLVTHGSNRRASRRGRHRGARAAQRQFGERPGQGHQDRPRQPAHRPARRLRRGRHFHPRAGARHPRQGPAERRQDLQGRDRLQGQPVERQPRRRSRVRTDPARQGRSAGGVRHARHHQPGVRPGRGQRGALHRHQLPVAAVFLRPQGRSGEGLQLDLSVLLGPGGRHRRVPRAVGRRADQQGRRRPVPERRRRQRLGRQGARPAAGARRRRLQAARSRPLSGDEQRLLVADRRVQGGRRRDRHRQHDPAGLRDVLVAGGAAGLQAEDRHHRQGAAVPVGDQLARRARQRPHLRGLVDAEPSVQVRPHRPELRAARRRLRGRRPSGRGRSRSASSTRCSKWRSTCSSAPRRSSRRRSSIRSSRPTTSRSSARCNGPASR